jgi:hypothetical protein
MAEEFQPTTRRPEVEFTRRGVQPPASLYVRQGELLFVEARSAAASQVVQLEGRLLLAATGEVIPLTLTVRPPADRSGLVGTIRLAEGFLLSLIVGLVGTTARRGQVYMRAGISTAPGETGIDPLILVQGYGTAEFVLAWPPGFQEPAVSGPGMLRSITGTDPAANTEINETVPTDARWRLHAVTAVLVTDGTAATRTARLQIDDGATVVLSIQPATTQIASLTRTYTAGAYGVTLTTYTPEIMWPLPPDLYLFQGWRIRTATDSRQVGDNWGAPQLLVEEWIEE